jgi:hypothetical protein
MRNRHNTLYDPALDSTQHLLWLGTQNSELNQMAREVLAGRGESSIFLRKYEKCLKSDGSKRRGLSRIAREGIKPDSWLAPTKLDKCCDCGKLTARTYNGGRIFQCEQCAEGVKYNGRVMWRASLAGRKAAIKKMNEIKQEQSQAIEPAEVIPDIEPSYEDALNESADTEAIKAAGNREAAQAGFAAYNESKFNSPLAQSIQSAREVKHVA